MMLELVPINISEANEFVAQHHRHSRPTIGGKFAVGVSAVDSGLVGVAIVGRPVARGLQDGWTAEVLRVCVSPKAPKNAPSMLYGASWRAWRAMGGKRLVTYTLQTEGGASLRGAGWKVVAETKAAGTGAWGCSTRKRDWQPIYGQQKFRWEAA